MSEFESVGMGLRLYIAKVLRRQKRLLRSIRFDRDLNLWKQQREDGSSFLGACVGIGALGLTEGGLAALQKELVHSREVMIAHIDQDGYFLSNFGPLSNLPCIEKEQFERRRKFAIDLVVKQGIVGVRKMYGDRYSSFCNEAMALMALRTAGCNVPALLEVDCDSCSLITAYIPGVVLREAIALKGALVRDRDIIGHTDFARLTEEEQRLRRIEEGKRYLSKVVDDDFIAGVLCQLCRIHEVGFTVNDIKYGNIVIEKSSGEPYFIDFELADDLRGFGKAFMKVLFELDIEKFKLHFIERM